jgi:aldose 1-epimerase
VVARIHTQHFGTLPDGRAVSQLTLSNRQGVSIQLIDFGAIITRILTPDRHGAPGDIVLGFDQLAPYVGQPAYFGAIIGRYANRIRHGRFELDGSTYQLPLNDRGNHLHGGPGGLHTVLWSAQPFQTADTSGVTLSHRSVHGDQGYPGKLDLQVTYELNELNELRMRCRAASDQATPVNLTQHSYFNLAGGGTILAHVLQIDADAFLPIDETGMPTGMLVPVEGSAFDFRQPHPIGAYIDDTDVQLGHGKGYDHNFVLRKSAAGTLAPAARVWDPGTGRVLELDTVEPGLQFYSGNFLDGGLSGKGRTYTHRSGLCLEPQHFPDAPNHPAFPATILRPGAEYSTVTVYRFGVEG